MAVTRHPTQAAVDEIVELFKPDVLQSDAADLQRLRLPASLERLPVVRDVAGELLNLPARILFEGALSGSGVASDWQLARQLSRRTQLILAGGLDRRQRRRRDRPGAALRRRRIERGGGAAGT